MTKLFFVIAPLLLSHSNNVGDALLAPSSPSSLSFLSLSTSIVTRCYHANVNSAPIFTPVATNTRTHEQIRSKTRHPALKSSCSSSSHDGAGARPFLRKSPLSASIVAFSESSYNGEISYQDKAAMTTQKADGNTAEAAPAWVAMGVGITTALIGFCYGKMMKLGYNFLWNVLPAAIFGGASNPAASASGSGGNGLQRLLRRNPAAYIVLVATIGASIVGTLSTLYFPKMFSAHDFVHILSGGDDSTVKDGEMGGQENKMDQFPRVRDSLLPVMALSLMTSISGFSLGPEAPMVCAGGITGVSLARKYSQYIASKNNAESAPKKLQSLQEMFAYIGAAGTLTGFMNIPIAGPVFALEMTSRNAGLSKSASKAWGTAIAAGMAGILFIRGGLVPWMEVGGHFTYNVAASATAASNMVHGREMVLIGLGCGAAGALVGTCFHKAVDFLKSVVWPAQSSSSSSPSSSSFLEKSAPILKRTIAGLMIGLLSTRFPQTMFWGEGSLQSMVDGQCTPLSATSHGIPSVMTNLAKVDPSVPFASVAGGLNNISSMMAALQVGLAKFTAIALASAAKLPGGVIFPLLSNGASLGHAFAHGLSALFGGFALSSPASLLLPMTVMSFMAAVLTSITRTPLSTVLILALTASATTPLSVLLPGVLIASYISVWVSESLSKDSFFSYSE